MLRIPVTERPDLMSVAADHGLKYSSSDGIEGWNEDVYYQFTLDQVELDLEGPAEELESLCFQVLERAVKNESVLKKLGIPEFFWNYIA